VTQTAKMNRLACLIPLMLLASCSKPSPRASSDGKDSTSEHILATENPNRDWTVFVEAHNMDKATQWDMEPVVLHEANMYFSHQNDCNGVFVTKNRGTADYELRFDYARTEGKVTMIGRLTILWDKSQMVVGTWSDSDIKKAVDEGASQTCSRISLFRQSQ